MNRLEILKKKSEDGIKARSSFSSGFSRVTYVILLAACLCTYLLVVVASGSGRSLEAGGISIPFSAFAGVFSSIANLIIIFLVVFFDRIGFISALVILSVQIPLVVRSLVMTRNVSIMPGIFISALTIVAVIIIWRRNKKIKEFQENEMGYLREQQRFSQRLFEQTATALVNAVDAKDTYSHGHSLRVAVYSEKIARAMGKSEEECYRIYYAALLHDVGKIGIDDGIINKNGRLTKEEYDVIKQHPLMGREILSSIREYPYLSLGAHYHHERYDGKGYPEGLKGDDIPEIARIISVADAYDAMTSSRSYRKVMPQQLVREEIVKGAGTQFDPGIAKIMQRLIDEDLDYDMREGDEAVDPDGRNEMRCTSIGTEVSDGILVTAYTTKIRFKYTQDDSGRGEGMPSLILFDALDGRVHDDEKTIRELYFFEYCRIRTDGVCEKSGARKIKSGVTDRSRESGISIDDNKDVACTIEATKIRDHVLIKINTGTKDVSVTVALPDSSRYVYIGLTGDHCVIRNISSTKADSPAGFDYIPRIAEEISYISGPEGDIPNIQVDGHRSGATFGVPVIDGMKLSFHTVSLPTARLIWHCPYIVLFYSEDREVYGNSYREFALIRLDGESSGDPAAAENSLTVHREDDLADWYQWKEANREGYDCVISFERHDNEVTVITENCGVSIRNTTTIKDGSKIVYVALTGDQCALTQIRVNRV